MCFSTDLTECSPTPPGSRPCRREANELPPREAAGRSVSPECACPGSEPPPPASPGQCRTLTHLRSYYNISHVIYFDMLRTVWWVLSHCMTTFRGLFNCNLPHHFSTLTCIFNAMGLHINRNYAVNFVLSIYIRSGKSTSKLGIYFKSIISVRMAIFLLRCLGSFFSKFKPFCCLPSICW